MPEPRLLSIYKLFFANIARAILALFFLSAIGFADSSLLYKEAQFIMGLSSLVSGPIFYSQSQQEMMQKPSLGFDFLHRFTNETGDKALIAFQGRLAWNAQGNNPVVEPQIYNAYLKIKNPLGGLWLGHSRPAYGLGSYFDSHALLLPILDMTDLGFDRDWGLGFLSDTDWGDFAISATTGSGMSLQIGNHSLVSGRVGFGVLNQNNFNFGLSKANGILTGDINLDYTGIDAAVLYNNYELRAENTSGTKANLPYHSFFLRGGAKFLDEDRLKLEVQQINYEQGTQSNQISSIGLSNIYDENMTLRLMLQNESQSRDTKIIFQSYYYTPW